MELKVPKCEQETDCQMNNKTNTMFNINHILERGEPPVSPHQTTSQNFPPPSLSPSLMDDLDSATKRSRTIFTPQQLQSMEKQFMKQQYIVGAQRRMLAKQLQLTEAQVKVWFQNRRIKWRKQYLQNEKTHLCEIAGAGEGSGTSSPPPSTSTSEESDCKNKLKSPSTQFQHQRTTGGGGGQHPYFLPHHHQQRMLRPTPPMMMNLGLPGPSGIPMMPPGAAPYFRQPNFYHGPPLHQGFVGGNRSQESYSSHPEYQVDLSS